ncbi:MULTISPECIES: dihydropteroate synthase [unclassified Paracoccus (in: a-proteobacteria)]|uniref:dihydropteroate synthase n=1 Tax=unclassified Paracoccus (in: a-proteobacteria) TaxID=2688777 RepID=UPI0012B2EC86|nr:MULTISPECIES: dihydropteroate synthase [unclassified Paracoccus (in: a-proteobacteria)]UXU75299.1 dihydropteroate synthase [Paracoccus sp. SMMA_5]UXU81201.1 dihydropteroate synthase [Paracoccus sp. SMMA_5_TC]
MSREYFRPVPEATGRWPLAGGWLRFSRLERLRRGAPAQIVEEAPDAVMARLTAPRAPLLGLALDRPRIMGIVNATPDSFSDGGSYDGAAHARLLADAGAEILDIGGESTRPGAQEVPAAQEIDRIRPVIAAARDLAPVSVDTRKSAVALAALAAGAGMVNDVSGLDFDPALARVTAAAGVPICLMHAQGVPATMQDDPRYGDVLLDVYDALEQRIARAEAAGIPRERIVIDPGIGFGKTQEHNLAILRRISVYHGLGCALLLGVSRKRFIGSIGGAERAADRTPGTLAVTLAAIAQGVQIHRVHDVAEIRQGLALWRAVTEGDE